MTAVQLAIQQQNHGRAGKKVSQGFSRRLAADPLKSFKAAMYVMHYYDGLLPIRESDTLKELRKQRTVK